MIDLTRTLFRLSSHDDNELEALVSANSLICDKFDVTNSANSITSNVYINHVPPQGTSGVDSTGSHTFPPVKFYKLEDLDVESIRKKQAEFLKTLHLLHIIE
ncbi:TPA: hypothetical protein JG809_004788 [Vibrio parahaemolyticus]|uniref:hypothetical protein n=1 Tax=Vibrio TaxID=662 RepID=UPI0003819165|nr:MULTISPECIES: hypothetical protein [Vibrio]EGQ7854936.1 hypothetical protein [Vibrio vulnificus]EHD0103789.1 hypothetical protein [Vibrio vulnificus]EJA7342686.1 hypothetical protein [Vibrio parahaemolyticus]EJC6746828.1 hypothetical protein [Vibrio vulnificus]EJC6822057.1 hypothetical protein [Vibrio vulnificus]